ncbi:MAG TPA: MFS transporter [Terriglobia bacterium]|nr:MFS transporter [Terriglobia bacterium]
MISPAQPSYRALLTLPSVGRLLAGMQIARIAQSMMGIAVVLFTLNSYHSPVLAGVATFFSIFPGIVMSPLAGALLDRYGRSWLVVLDYFVTMTALILLGVLFLVHLLPVWLLLVIVTFASMTSTLSGPGLRSLFPIIVPSHLWERINAVDSAGFVIATIVGPPIAAVLVSVYGGAATLITVGLAYGLAAIVLWRTPNPPSHVSTKGSLLADAWHGLRYTWGNPTLRGLAVSLSTLNLGGGALNIVVPLIVLERLHMSDTVVGLVFAVQGITGMASAVFVGRTDTRGRERMMLAIPMLVTALLPAVLLLDSTLTTLILAMALVGFLNGPIDIALFTLRQRRTAAAMRGRAFAISMSLNYMGSPIGSAIAGTVAARSIGGALFFILAASLMSGALVLHMIPRSAEPKEENTHR